MGGCWVCRVEGRRFEIVLRDGGCRVGMEYFTLFIVRAGSGNFLDVYIPS